MLRICFTWVLLASLCHISLGFLDNIVNSLFGDDGDGFHMHHHGHGRPRTQDAVVELKTTLNELYNGVQKQISYKRNVICNHCHGTGAEGGETKRCSKCGGRGKIITKQQIAPGFTMQSENVCPKCKGKGQIYKKKCNHCRGKGVHQEMTKLDVDIERGMKDGEDIIFEGKAEERPGHDTGSLVVRLKQERHKYFTRLDNGNHLETTVEISLTQSLLGFDLNIEHLDERWINLYHVNEISYFGQRREYKNEGMPIKRRNSRFGNLYVIYRVKMPEKLTDEEQKSIREAFSEYSLDGEYEGSND